jgi:hypothetical protein
MMEIDESLYLYLLNDVMLQTHLLTNTTVLILTGLILREPEILQSRGEYF